MIKSLICKIFHKKTWSFISHRKGCGTCNIKNLKEAFEKMNNGIPLQMTQSGTHISMTVKEYERLKTYEEMFALRDSFDKNISEKTSEQQNVSSKSELIDEILNKVDMLYDLLKQENNHLILTNLARTHADLYDMRRFIIDGSSAYKRL